MDYFRPPRGRSPPTCGLSRPDPPPQNTPRCPTRVMLAAYPRCQGPQHKNSGNVKMHAARTVCSNQTRPRTAANNQTNINAKRPRPAFSRHISPGAALQSPENHHARPRPSAACTALAVTSTFTKGAAAHTTHKTDAASCIARQVLLCSSRTLPAPLRVGSPPAPDSSQNRRLPAFNRIKAEPAAARNSRTHPQIEPGSTTAVPAALTFCTRASLASLVPALPATRHDSDTRLLGICFLVFG